MSFGRIGRTDQGVDISAPPGTNVPNIFGGDVQVVGVIRNWYRGQPYEWFKVLTGKLKGAYVYGAEQINFASYRPGTVIGSGRSLGRIASSGTGTEFGLATPSGRTLASATTGYTEGQPTPAGLRFRSFLVNNPSAATGTLQQFLEQKWIDNGGPIAQAPTAAAVSMAESGGRLSAKSPRNSNGTYDYGPWQVNSSHGFDPQRLTSDWDYSARAAVSVYKSQGWTAWTTFVNGAYRSFLNQAGGTSPSGMVRPDGTDSGPSANLFADYVSLDSERQAPQEVGFNPLAPFKWWYKNFSDSWKNFYHDLTGPADTLVKTGEETAAFASEGVKILENLPFYLLRGTEFIIGILLMYLGVRSVISGGQPSTASIARVTREIGAATPAGRARRMARGRRAGTREGEIEHARLEARRSTRQREARREQERGQRRRELRNQN